LPAVHETYFRGKYVSCTAGNYYFTGKNSIA